LGKTPLNQLTPQHLQTALTAMLSDGVQPPRVAHVRTGSHPYAFTISGTAMLLLANGVSLGEIAEILGHRRIGITAGLYAHVGPELKQRAAEVLDAAIVGG
jgi:integrase